MVKGATVRKKVREKNMLRYDIVDTVGKKFLTSNIEAGEYSYVQEAGGRAQLEKRLEIAFHISN